MISKRGPASPAPMCPALSGARPGVFALLLALVGAGGVSGQSGEDAAEVGAVVEAVGTGLEAGDFAAHDTLLAAGPGVHIIEGAGVNHGWSDYRDHHLAPELEVFEDFSYRWFSIEPVVEGDAAWAAFRYELAADTPDGHVEVEGRGTIVLQRRDSRWRVVHLHTSGRRR
mgnify:FL=1